LLQIGPIKFGIVEEQGEEIAATPIQEMQLGRFHRWNWVLQPGLIPWLQLSHIPVSLQASMLPGINENE
jgi:hypothetical protein